MLLMTYFVLQGHICLHSYINFICLIQTQNTEMYTVITANQPRNKFLLISPSPTVNKGTHWVKGKAFRLPRPAEDGRADLWMERCVALGTKLLALLGWTGRTVSGAVDSLRAEAHLTHTDELLASGCGGGWT